MSIHADDITLENIQHAQSHSDIPPDVSLVEYDTLGVVLEAHATSMPDKIWLIHYDEVGTRTPITYQEFNRVVNQIAHFLLDDLQLKTGDRIATMGYNHAETVMLYFAAWRAGVVVAPQNIKEDDRRIRFILENTESVILFARPELLDRARSIAEPIPTIREIIQYGGEAPPDARHLQTEITFLSEENPITTPLPPDTEALFVYTSGTTGNPKGVVLTHYNLMVDAQGMIEWHGITQDQRTMCVLPIHHANGIMVTLITPMMAGASTVLNYVYSSSQFWARLAAENVQIVSVVPTLLQFSLEYAEQMKEQGKSIYGEDITRDDLADFRHLICGAGTLSVKLALDFEAMFGVPIMHGYGLSETTCYSCFLPLDYDTDTHTHWLKDYGYPSIGAPIHTNEMAIFDPEGNILGEGERGEICVRGHNVMKYYFKRPDANSETFKWGWFRTGDEGFYQMDKDGRKMFFITGRLKELINRGGVKFSPFDIEEVMLQLPEVNTALAIAFPNAYFGEEVGAYIVLNEGKDLTEETVIAHCRDVMTFEKSPKVVVFGTDIPVTSTGKYQRLKLHHLFTEWEHTQFRP